MKQNKSKYIVRNHNVKNIYTSYDSCPVDIPYDDFISIIEGFMKFISAKIIDGEMVILPVNSGRIEVIGKKIKPRTLEDGTLIGVAPDWVGTKKLWDSNPEAKKNKTLVYHFNEHSNGIRYKIHWFKLKSGVMHKGLYSFYPTRSNSRAIWKAIMSNKEYRIDTERDSKYKKSY
jgi:hypothetical protein